MDLDDGLDLRRRKLVAPLPGPALAEEALRLFRTFLETLLLLLFLQVAERALLDRLEQAGPRRVEPEETDHTAKRLLGLGQHVLIAHDMKCGAGPGGPAGDMLAPGTHHLE